MSEWENNGETMQIDLKTLQITTFPHSYMLSGYVNPDQVMQVVREQITRALAMKPSSLDQLKNKLRGLNYSEILRLRQSERMSQDDFQSPPIMYVCVYNTSVSVTTRPLHSL